MVDVPRQANQRMRIAPGKFTTSTERFKADRYFFAQRPKFCAIFFSKINPDAHVSTKTNTFTFYKWGLGGGGGGVNSLVKEKKLMWNKIHARGDLGSFPGVFFLLKWSNLVHSECSQNTFLST